MNRDFATACPLQRKRFIAKCKNYGSLSSDRSIMEKPLLFKKAFMTWV
jgi:hypothetical protein